MTGGHQIKYYPEVINLTPTHYFYIIEAASGVGADVDQKISVLDFFSNLPVSATFQGNVTAQTINVTGNYIQLSAQQYTPANSSVTFGPSGAATCDNNYLYVQVSPGVNKRIPLESY